jgi:hypothetical protein
MPARLLLLCLLLRSSWLTVDGGRGRRRQSAASPGRTGSRRCVGRRGCWRSKPAVRGTASAATAFTWSSTRASLAACSPMQGQLEADRASASTPVLATGVASTAEPTPPLATASSAKSRVPPRTAGQAGATERGVGVLPTFHSSGIESVDRRFRNRQRQTCCTWRDLGTHRSVLLGDGRTPRVPASRFPLAKRLYGRGHRSPGATLREIGVAIRLLYSARALILAALW